MSMAQRRAELLADVIDHASAALRELGVDGAHADQCAHALADHLAEHWGGQVISIPQDYAVKLSAREREIVALHKSGIPKDELARRYRIAYRSINRLLHRASTRDAVDAQLDLFGAAQ